MKWEYSIFSSGQDAADPELVNSLTQLGDEGWELVSVTFEIHEDENGEYFERNYFFKRPAAEPEAPAPQAPAQ